MSDNFLVDFSIEFATKIVNLTEQIQGKGVLKNQILKSGTSIGANIHEANYAQSKADFVSKLQIALKECYETEYWLKLFSKTDIIDRNVYSELQNDCGKIRRVLISSINTTKENYKL
ncbi:MAG: four helix bundle protein [Clostridia bacterium]|nr:four helix bundle protein [Clostridia bacterium]